MCVFVYVCVRKRERRGEREKGERGGKENERLIVNVSVLFSWKQ